jgi:hypothetical protein
MLSFFDSLLMGFRDPGSLSGIVSWIGADNVNLSSSKITQFNDKSIKSNPASQSNDSLRPTLVSNQINGLPIARFASGGNWLSFANNGDFSNGMTFIVVVKLNGTSTFHALYTKTSTNQPRPFDIYAQTPSTKFEIALGTSPQSSSLGTSNYKIFAFSHDKTTGRYVTTPIY